MQHPPYQQWVRAPISLLLDLCIGGRRQGDPVDITGIKIKEEEIARKYDKGALPLVAMPILLYAHLLVQGQGFQGR